MGQFSLQVVIGKLWCGTSTDLGNSLRVGLPIASQFEITDSRMSSRMYVLLRAGYIATC